MSECMTAVPVPCETPQAPTSLGAAGDGDNSIVLDWDNSDPITETYNVYRATGTCPQGNYDLIASGITGMTYADEPVSGWPTFAYVVAGVDISAGCPSAFSNCAETQTTGECTLAPLFAGVETVANSASVSLRPRAHLVACNHPVRRPTELLDLSFADLRVHSRPRHPA